jgi:hypothetical protein
MLIEVIEIVKTSYRYSTYGHNLITMIHINNIGVFNLQI